MRGCRIVGAAAVAAIVAGSPVLFARQQPPAAEATAPRPEQIRQELDKIKKSRTLSILPAQGTDDSGGATLLRVDNASPFSLVILIVGPTTQRVELGSDRTHTLTVEPGDYEIAVTVVGRNLPSFYGKQTIIANMLFRQKFVVPTA